METSLRATPNMRICALTDLHPGLPVVMTIGMFDGMHRGHQALIGQVIQQARALGGQSVVLTFNPHPRAVLAPDAPLYELSSTAERLQLIAGQGVDIVATLGFTSRIAQLPPEAFLDIIQKHVALRELWGGPDFALGHRRAGTIARLQELGAQRGFTVHVLPPVDIAGGPVSSSRVRELVAAGNVQEATLLLGRFPRLDGIVARGLQRGRTLGFPTANLALTTPYLLPANGVYAVFADVDGVRWPAVANIGMCPTFNSDTGKSAGNAVRLVEVYILDLSGDLYGRRLSIHLVKRLRDEVRFPSVDALVAQMHKDVAGARTVLGSMAPQT